MKLLNNEFEYREWMVKDYLHLDEEFPSVFEPDELERELLNLMPKEFPCLVDLLPGPNNFVQESITFIYRSEVEEWAKLLGIIN